MKHLSYFVALAAIGSFVLLLGLAPFIGIAHLSIALALGLPSDSEAVKIGINSTIAVLWVVALIGYWIHKNGLAPQGARSGRGAQLVWGHLCLIAGHELARDRSPKANSPLQ